MSNSFGKLSGLWKAGSRSYVTAEPAERKMFKLKKNNSTNHRTTKTPQDLFLYPKTVFIGIGTNKGKREKNISLALKLLTKNKDIQIHKVSKMLKNPPQEGIRTGYFLNGAIKVLTTLSPHKLLQLCKKIERKLGRKTNRRIRESGNLRKKRARTIDLDILFYGNKIIKTKNLKIPHPRLHRRSFVLKPLNEIAPYFVHPLLKKSISHLAKG